METAPLKSFATSARTELLREVGARLTSVLAPGSSERVERPSIVASLEDAITEAGGGEAGRKHVIDRAAYMWFNRIVALRFMDANGYTGIGVVSPATDQVGQPEVLAVAKRGQIDGEVVRPAEAATIFGLLSGTVLPSPGGEAQAEAYALLLTSYCRFWNRAMPSMFEAEGDFSELLIPGNLLAEGSVLDRACSVLSAEVCEDVEVIGWLYQFYISERKDEVFAGFKKNEKAGAEEIPAATQLFTPHWIVRYLAENSIGRLWMLNHPNSTLIERMDYYIEPVDEENDFLRIDSPEEITVIDPACGSGHMLTYAFDLLYAIYEEEGYAPSSIPTLILEKNLRGTEIDQRAGALASFALSMKAASKRKRFLKEAVAPRIQVLEPIVFRPDELDFLASGAGDREAEEAFWNMFEHADTFGSLIQADPSMVASASLRLRMLDGAGDMLVEETLDKAKRVITQAEYLLPGYSVVIANPPYMGSKQMNDLLSRFMKETFPEGKSDLFAGFVIRCLSLLARDGLAGFMTPFVWMFIKSYEALRRRIIERKRIVSLIQLEYSGFEGATVPICTYVLQNGHSEVAGSFVRLSDFVGPAVQGPTALKIIEDDKATRRGASTSGMEEHLFRVSSSSFTTIPGSPIVYWLSEKMRATFNEGRNLGEIAELLVGLRTGDNARFLRFWWEVDQQRTMLQCSSLTEAKISGRRWFPYNKGGSFRRWYGNHEYVVNWENDGREIEEGLAKRYPYLVPAGQSVVRGQGRACYFSPSVSWSDISSGEAAFRRYPAGFIHDSTGHSGFSDLSTLDQVSLLMNSSFSAIALQVLAPTMHFHIGYVGQVPIPRGIEEISTERLDRLVINSKSDWDSAETSWGFRWSPLVAISRDGLPS
ncbi:BREX-1 system adenine-specific DNA-methyltransferase PglX [Schaalia sp.]|uniref:BREX-1 system adenine-specific DNA-methyltransferase PglX n=1 Tax=Schaalia sp. TaxID=2691890 RepID=UPI003D134FBE